MAERAHPGGELRLRIGEAAARAGVSERTLRYYEEIGLLSPAGHSVGGCREYGPAELARVTRIRELQELLGLELDEIRGVVAREDRIDTLRDAYRRSEGDEERRAILLEALQTTEALYLRVSARVERIAAFRDELAETISRYRTWLAGEIPQPERPAAV